MSEHTSDQGCVSIDVHAEHALVTVTGDIDLCSVGYLEGALSNLARHGIRHFRINLREAPFMDSTGLQVLMNLVDTNPYADVIVSDASPMIRRLLDIVDLDRCRGISVLHRGASLPEALSA